ncbi:MAG: hypothetical protein LAN71_05635 [Acidobacteriia bacterium]|nr:hypothetical protein [Terriglobia bacterium]
MTAQTYTAPDSVARLSRRALIVGVLGLAACGIAWTGRSDEFYHAYLIGYLLVLGAALGSLGLLMVQHMTGGKWGILIRRPLEAATRTLPLLALFFLPIFLGVSRIYGWAQPVHGELSEFQKNYLTVEGFRTRAVIYFAIWTGLALLLNRLSIQQDSKPEDRMLRRQLQLFSGPGIVLYVFTMTLAAVDWVMSLSPQWVSTIYGFLFVIGQAITAMSLMIAILVMLAKSEPMSRVVEPKHLHDLGKLLFAFIMLWAYFSFSQLLIIWSGNLPEEIVFYKARLMGTWGFFAVALLLLHFALPFLLLLSRDVKRSSGLLPKVAMFLIAMRLVDLTWITGPEFSRQGFQLHYADLAAPLGIGGIWLFWFAKQLQQRPLLPLGDPKLAEVTEHNEH